jgi:hypothetical protein
VLLGGAQERGLHAAVAEVEGIAEPGAGQAVEVGIAARGGALDRGAAGVAEAEDARALVESFAGRVVGGAPEQAVVSVALHHDQLGVAAGDDQADQREGGGRRGEVFPRLEEPVGVEVPFQMVDRDQRQAARPGDRLGPVDTDHQRSRQPRALGDGEGVDVVQRETGTVERGAHGRLDRSDVPPRGEFGHDAAVLAVEVDLRGDHVGE